MSISFISLTFTAVSACNIIHTFIFEGLWKRICDEIDGAASRKLLIGNDDDCFVLKNLSWAEFLGLYAPYDNNGIHESGILTSGNSDFFKSTYSISTNLMIEKIRR